MNIEILFEDNHLIVVNKPVGMLVQGDKTGDKSILDFVKEYIKKKYDKPGNVYLGLPHRLDRPTSGIVVLSKTSKALSRLNSMFKDNTIKKTYWAIVDNAPEKKTDTLVHYLVRNEKSNKSKAFNKPSNKTKKASLTYDFIGKSDRFHLLEIDLHTGRHHQIRAQLAKINCHIKGDLKYGSKRSNKDGGIHLHSRQIEFIHPVKKDTLKIIAPPPKDPVWDFFVENI